MERMEWTLDGRPCRLYRRGEPRFLLLQMADAYDLEGMAGEMETLCAATGAPFLLAALPVRDWNGDLSPWPAPPVFGDQAFAGRAAETLAWLREKALPEILASCSLPEGLPVILGGYSLAGLFALWAAHEAQGFDGVAAASPSVWFPDFSAYAARQPIRARAVYLSLGDREEKTKNPVMRQVGACIRALHGQYAADPRIKTVLEWNEGNHFRDADKRTGKAFAWTMEALLQG